MVFVCGWHISLMAVSVLEEASHKKSRRGKMVQHGFWVWQRRGLSISHDWEPESDGKSLSGSAAPHGDATHYQQTIRASTNVWVSGHNQNIMGNKKKPGDSFSLSWHKLLESGVEETKGRSRIVVWGYPESWKSLLLFSLWKIWQGAATWGQLRPAWPFCTRQPTSRGGKRLLMSHTLGRHTLVFATTGV